MRGDILPLAAYAEEVYNVHPDLQAAGVEVIFRRYNGHLAVIFRGSQGLKDWLTDGEAWHSPIGDTGFKGHHGFNEGVDAIWPQLWVKIRGEELVYIVGHSKGGGDGTNAALRAVKGGLKVILITFGCPRCLEPQAAAWLAERLTDCVRVVNDDDPVTKAPGPLFYRHVGPPTIIKKGLSLGVVTDHLMGSHYIPALIAEGFR